MKYKNLRNRLIDSVTCETNTNILNPLYGFSSLIFTVIIIYFIIIRFYNREFLFSMSGILSILLSGLGYIFHRKKYLNSNMAIILNVLVYSAGIYFVIIMETFNPSKPENSIERILISMLILFALTIIGGLTTYHQRFMLVTILSLTLYSISSLVINDPVLVSAIPVFIIVFLCTHIFTSYLVTKNNGKRDPDNEMTLEQKSLINFFNLDYGQWQQIKMGKLDRELAESILFRMEKDLQDKLVYLMKGTVQAEEEIKGILRRKHPDLTCGEQQLCCFIIHKKPVSEIAKLRNISNSAVTLMRSRIRKKIGLKQEDSLNDYLESLVRSYIRM